MNTISIPYKLVDGNNSCTIQLFYTLEHNGAKLNLTCYVQASYPHLLPWMQTRSFKTRYSKVGHHYQPVRSEPDYEKTQDAIRFMDIAYKAIMASEGLTVSENKYQHSLELAEQEAYRLI